MKTEQIANDAIVIVELQTSNKLLAKENELLKKSLIEAQGHISTISRKLIEPKTL